MFGRDYDLMPRTYSIKSYRKRQSSALRKVLVYTTYSALVAVIIGVVFLSVTHLI